MAAPAVKKKVKGLWNLFEKKDGGIARRNKSCPKCGHGYFLANHKTRVYCGKCGYAEFVKV